MTSPTNASRDLVFIDADVPDLAALLAGLTPLETAYVLDPSSDGIAEIADIVAADHDSDVASIAIVGHGAAGQIDVGGTTLDAAALSNDADALSRIGAALAPGGALDLYACNTAAGASGQAFISDLSIAAGGVDVVASTHLVGSADDGGSWTLNAATEAPAAAAPFTSQALANYKGELGTGQTLEFAGVNYVADYYGALQNFDNLSALRAENVDAIALTADFGINAVDDTIYDNDVSGGYTESDEAIASTITQANSLGLQTLYRPLVDFLAKNDGSYYPDDWRAYFNPGAAGSTKANTFFASYQTMIVAQAKVAQQAGAQIFSIGLELDGITGPAYETYWDNIIAAVRAVYSGKLTYGAIWDDAGSPWQWGGSGLKAGTGNITTQVSFWNKLDYVGIDEYAPISNLANPTVAQLIDGWTQAPTDDVVSSVTGGQSLMSYYENISASIGKPLMFTEIGYGNSSDAAINPASPGYDINGNPDHAVADPTLQANLYTAFLDAWTQYGNGSLAGAYVWEWEPSGADSGNVWDVEGLSAESAIAAGYASSSTITFGAAPSTVKISGAAVSGSAYAETLSGFAPKDMLDVEGLTYVTGATATIASSELKVSSGAVYQYFWLKGTTAANFAVISDGSGGSDVVGLAAGPVDTVAQFLANTSTLNGLATGFYIADTGANVASQFDALSGDAHINGILLTDAGAPSLTLTAAEIATDTQALGAILNPVYSITAQDSAANVSADIVALAANSRLAAIDLSDAGVPVLTLTAAETVTDATTLGKIVNGAWKIAIQDSAADVSANFDALNGNARVSSITLNDAGTPTLELTATQLSLDTTALGEITNNLFEALVGTAAYYFAGGNGTSGPAISLAASNATVTLKADSNMALTGSNDAVAVSADSDFTVHGSTDAITATTGDRIWIESGTGDTITGAGVIVTAAARTAIAVGGNGVSGASDVVDGQTSANLGIDGNSNVTLNGSSDTVTMLGSSDLTVSGSTDAISATFGDKISLTSGTGDTIKAAGVTVTGASGTKFTIGGNGVSGANDVVDGSSLTVAVQSNSRVTLNGSSDTVTMGATSDLTVYGSTDTITATTGDRIWIDSGSGHTITGAGVIVTAATRTAIAVGGNGVSGANDVVNGAANASVGIDASSNVTLNGSSDTITMGATSDLTVAGSTDAISATFGDKISLTSGTGDTIKAAGVTVTGASGTKFTIGGNGVSGANDVVDGSGLTVAVQSNSRVTLNGSSDTVTMGATSDLVVDGSTDAISATTDDVITVSSGTGEVISGSGFTVHGGSGAGFTIKGTGDIVYAGLNDALTDGGASDTFKIGSNVGSLKISDFGSDTTGIVDLLNGVGGYTTAAAAFHALASDGAGGSLLSLGTDGSIDLLGVAPTSLQVTNFKIG